MTVKELVLFELKSAALSIINDLKFISEHDDDDGDDMR